MITKPSYLWRKQLVSPRILSVSSEHLLQSNRVRHYHYGTNTCISIIMIVLSEIFILYRL